MLNLTQHPATTDQLPFVVDLVGQDLADLKALLTFDSLPDAVRVEARARSIAELAKRVIREWPANAAAPTSVMIGGAPFLMAPLQRWLEIQSIEPFYAFSQRESVEETLPDGSVRKVNVFKHAGFVPACR